MAAILERSAAINPLKEKYGDVLFGKITVVLRGNSWRKLVKCQDDILDWFTKT